MKKRDFSNAGGELERKYYLFIKTEFPEYANYWEEFVMSPVYQDGIKRELSFTGDNINNHEIEDLRKYFRQIHEFQYSQLAHLGSILNILTVLKKYSDRGEYSEEIWQNVYCFYAHMRTSIDIEELLWAFLYRMDKYEKKDEWDKLTELKSSKLKDYYDKIMKPIFKCNDIKFEVYSLQKKISNIRNYLIHNTTIASVGKRNDEKVHFQFPKENQKSPVLWFEQVLSNEFQTDLATAKTDKDWLELLSLIRKLRQNYIEETRIVFERHNLEFR